MGEAVDPRATRRVFACGYYGFGNEGDEAILEGLRAGLEAQRPGLGWVVTSGDPEATAARHGVEAVPWTDMAAIVDAVASSELILVGGGGLFQDYWGCDLATLFTPAHNSVTFYGLPVLLAAFLGKPALLQDVGVGPLETTEGRALVRGLAETASGVSVRDRASKELLASLGLSPDRVLLSGDASFHLAPPPSSGERDEDRIGVSLRHWPFGPAPEAWERPVAEALDRVLEQRPAARVVFVPLQAGGRELEDDHAVGARVRDRLRHRDRADVLDPRERPGGARGVLAQCRVVLGMRLHALLFAMAAGRPVVGLSYDPKIEAALGDAGLEENVVSLEDLPKRDLAGLLDKARPVDPAHVEGLRRRVLGSAKAAIAAMASREPATLAPTLGAVVIEAWMKQLQQGSPDHQDTVRRLQELQGRWETLAAQVRHLRSNLRGHLSHARPDR